MILETGRVHAPAPNSRVFGGMGLCRRAGCTVRQVKRGPMLDSLSLGERPGAHGSGMSGMRKVSRRTTENRVDKQNGWELPARQFCGQAAGGWMLAA